MATQFTPAVLHTITNPDGTVSIVQVDPNNPIITLPDGTTAHVQGLATVSSIYPKNSVFHKKILKNAAVDMFFFYFIQNYFDFF